MGKIPQGILGGVSGKIGGVVGSSWKGINVIKTKPLSVANPKTAGQVAQRSKFSNAVAFAQTILSVVIKPLWDRFASKQSGYNAFIQTNISLFSDSVPNPIANLIISKGKMAKTDISAITALNAADTVKVDWVDDSGEGFKLAADIAYLVVIDEDSEAFLGFETTATRADQTVTVDFPNLSDVGNDVHVYLAFKRSDGTVVSNTSYLSEAIT